MLTALAAICNAVMIALVVVVIESMACAVTVELARAEVLVIEQLRAGLMRGRR